MTIIKKTVKHKPRTKHINGENKKTQTRKLKSSTFDIKDFNSGDGMLTKVWGPAAWFLLHNISFNYPVNPTKKQKQQYKDFIYSLRNVLPCKYCRINLANNLKENPITNFDLENRTNFSKYIYNLHEIVNKMLNKNSGLSYEDVRSLYENFRARCSLKDEKNKLFVFNNKSTKEKGCTEPITGKKSKCVISIVPQEVKSQTLNISKECFACKKQSQSSKDEK